jgi:hexosaminidase
MRKYVAIASVAVLFLVFFAVSTPCAENGSSSPSIVPKPAVMSVGEGVFVLRRPAVIIADRESKAVGEYLAGALQRALGYRPEVIDASAADSMASENGAIVLSVNEGAKQSDPESYLLEIDTRCARIAGNTPAGVFYGCQTFRQLLPAEALADAPVSGVEWSAPCVRIEDRPRFAWRGVLLDVCRHFQDKQSLKKFIDELAFYKINRLQWHLTDDQGWRVEIKKYPKLTEVGAWRKTPEGKPYGGFYTQDDIREIVAYAAERFITIVPEIEMPGHASAAAASYPWITCRGEPIEVQTKWGIFPDLYCAGNDRVFSFIEDVLTEILPLFPSKYVHIGGDEALKTYWKTCEKCQARIKAEGLKNEGELQSYFIKRIAGFLQSKNRVLIGWDEILEGGLPKNRVLTGLDVILECDLPPQAVVMSWRSIEGGIAAAQNGHDAIMSPVSHCYFDYPQYLPGEREPRLGFTPLEHVYSYEPIPPQLNGEEAKHILGAQANVWTEHLITLTDVERMTFPRLLALSEVVWSPKENRSYSDFSKRLPEQKRKLDNMRVEYFREPK